MSNDAPSSSESMPAPQLDAPPLLTAAALTEDESHPEQGRHVAIPLILFLATCLSTFWTGAVAWKPIIHLEGLYRE